MRVRLALYGVAVCLCLASIVSAQDAVKTDPKHYTVVTENDQVRILKVHYGPHEKSIMHSHPATVAVFLTDAKGQFSFPDGKKAPFSVKEAVPLPPGSCRRQRERQGQSGLLQACYTRISTQWLCTQCPNGLWCGKTMIETCDITRPNR
jgi:hypothetical protein